MDFLQEVLVLKKRSKKLYIYGAGVYGQNINKILLRENIIVDGFLVSKLEDQSVVMGNNVYEADQVLERHDGIIIGANRHNTKDIIQYLQKKEINEKQIIEGYRYLDNDAIRGGYDEIPTIEITTTMGCKIQCKYCPQSTLISHYYSMNSKRVGELGVSDFDKYLNKLPDNCVVIFSGMAEPFLNRNCIKMIRMAHERGHLVDVYTTLVGVTESDINELCELPVNFMGVHVADKMGFSKIDTTEAYYSLLDVVINMKKTDGKPLVNICNSQTEPDEQVTEICKGKCEILTTMLDRAGNLEYEELYKRKNTYGKLSCSICGNKLNHNVLLPDGTVLLCCMDYGMKHILGNLNDDSYEEIINGREHDRIRKGMLGDLDEDIICRNCSCANVV